MSAVPEDSIPALGSAPASSSIRAISLSRRCAACHSAPPPRCVTPLAQVRIDSVLQQSAYHFDMAAARGLTHWPTTLIAKSANGVWVGIQEFAATSSASPIAAATSIVNAAPPARSS